MRFVFVHAESLLTICGRGGYGNHARGTGSRIYCICIERIAQDEIALARERRVALHGRGRARAAVAEIHVAVEHVEDGTGRAEIERAGGVGIELGIAGGIVRDALLRGGGCLEDR